MSGSAWVRREDNTYGQGKFPFGRCEVPGCKEASCYRVPAFAFDEEKDDYLPENDNGNLLVCLDHKPRSVAFAPFLGQQEKLWSANARYVLGGGGTGGAKTYLGSWLWMKLFAVEKARFDAGEIETSKARFLFLRRTIPEVKQVIDGFMSIFKQIDPAARWDHDHNVATFPSAGGMKVQFGGCEHEHDWEKYWGHEYTIVVIDEATQFWLKTIRHLDLRIRSADPVLSGMCQLYLLTNPIGAKSGPETKAYFKKNYVSVAEPETVFSVDVKLEDGRKVKRERVYIPCNLYDNPALQRDGQYEATLQSLPAHLRRALLTNDWDVDEGAWVGEDWDKTVHVCDPFPIPPSATKWKAMDYGMSARSAIHWYARLRGGGIVCYRSFSVRDKTASQLADIVRDIESQPLHWVNRSGKRIKIVDVEWDEESSCSTVFGPADKSLWHRQGESNDGESRGDILDRKGCGFYRARADKESRDDAADLIRMHLRARVPHPFADARMVAGVRFFSTCETRELDRDGFVTMTGPIHTIPNVPFDENRPNVWDTDADDHDIDTLGYSVVSRASTEEAGGEAEVYEMTDYRPSTSAVTGGATSYDW